MGTYYIQVQFSNGTMNGYCSTEQPHFNDLMDAIVFSTETGSTVWLPVKSILSVEFCFNEAPEQPQG